MLAENAPSPPTIPATPLAGATMRSEYMGRTMKCYPVHEHEMDILSTLNTQTTVFFSAASAFAGIAVSIWISAAFAEAVTVTVKMATLAIGPAALFIALIFGGLALMARKKRSDLWGRIQTESAGSMQAKP